MRPAIETKGLVKVYKSGEEDLQVLKRVGLGIARGEFASIMGPSGSGKSTLLNLVGLLDVPTAGTVRLNGQDVSALTRNQRAITRRKLLGFVFQSFHLLPRSTALDNVILPMRIAGVPRKERKTRAAELLDIVGLSDRMTHRPNKLSGGQKQRVAIARSLAMDPPIILADEPTGNLDSATSAELMALFGTLHRRGKTVVQVTHDRSMADFSDRVIHFKDGVIHRLETRPNPRGPVAPQSAFSPRDASGGRPRPRRVLSGGETA